MQSQLAKGITSWEDTREQWLATRREGVCATDVAAIMGTHPYKGEWSVWANKTGLVVDDSPPSQAARLGIDLEPWLLQQAPALIGQGVAPPDWRLYRHPGGPYMASPDGVAADGSLVECKTAGLLSGRIDSGWTLVTIPAHYDWQVRWQMLVMDAPRVHVVALLAGHGLTHTVIERNTRLEESMLKTVSSWWDMHVIHGCEPIPDRRDSNMVASAYPQGSDTAVDLSSEALDLAIEYRTAASAEREAKARKEDAATALKSMLGGASQGVYQGREIVSWTERKGAIDYKAALESTEVAMDLNPYRRPSTRTLTVRGL